MSELKSHGIYMDNNRLTKSADRKFHAADAELAGMQVQVVPAIAREQAPTVVVGRWEQSRGLLEQKAGIARGAKDESTMLRTEWEKWWLREWSKANGLYRVRLLNPEERDVRNRLLLDEREGLPRRGFPGWRQGEFHDHGDAQAVAEVLAVNGKMFVTSDDISMDLSVINGWVARTQNKYGWKTAQAVVEVDEQLAGWTRLAQGKAALLRSCVGGYWPENSRASNELVREKVRNGVAALQRGHLPRFAEVMLEEMKTPGFDSAIEKVRGRLPERMRAAERSRPNAERVERMARGAAESIEDQRISRTDVWSRWE